MMRTGRSPWHALAAFLLVPGTVAFLVPWLLRPPGARFGAAGAAAFHLRVVLGEEPWLARRHGARWEAYRDAVPRWLLPPRRPGPRQGLRDAD